MSESLHRETADLPSVAAGDRPDPLGRSTRGAILSGIHHAICGGIDRLIDELSRDRKPLDVHLTGGDAQRVSPGLRHSHVVSPCLVLEGLSIAATQLRRADGEMA